MSMFAGDLSSKYLRQGYGMPTSSLRNQPTQAGMGVSSTIKQPLRNTGGRGLPNLRETSAYKQGLTRNIDQNMGGYVNPSLFSDPNLGRSQGRDQGPIGTGVPASDVPAFNPKYNSGITGGMQLGQPQGLENYRRQITGVEPNDDIGFMDNGMPTHSGIVSRAQLGAVRTASDGPAFDPHKANMELGQAGGIPPITGGGFPIGGQPNPYQTNVDFMNQMAQKNAQVGSDGSSIFPTFSYDPKTNQYMRDSSAFGLTGDAANTYYSPEDFQSEFGRTLGKMPPQGGGDQGPIGTGVPASDVPAFDPSYNSGVAGNMGEYGGSYADPALLQALGYGVQGPTGIANDPVLTGSADDLSNPYYYNSGVAGNMGEYGGSYADPSLGQTGIANDPVLTNGSGYFDTSGGNTGGTSPYAPLDIPSGTSPSDSNSGYWGSALGGLLSGDWLGALRGAGDYYSSQKDIEGAYRSGLAGMEMAQQLGQQVAEGSQFKPYTVTSNLAQVQTDPRGGYNVNLSPQQQALQNQALGQAGQFFGQAGSYDPSIAAQRGAMGGLFGQSLGQYGQPTGLEGLTQAGISGAQGQLSRAGQPFDINQLRGQFAGQVGSYLGQQPDAGIGALGQQALRLGSQGLGDVSAPTDIEALRAQYAGLAGQAGQGLLSTPEQRQADIYESIRATQTPEEQRQRLALEERMLAQGRTGVSSDAYGGASPELLAMETARQEAMARAGLSARQQAMAEQEQGLATAQSLTGLTTGLAGTSSDLQSAAQSRATQLSQLGLSAEQIESQLQSEGLSRATTAGTTAGQLAGIASDLETAGIGRGTALANLGLAGTQESNTMGRQQLEDLMNLQRSDMSSAQIQQALQQGNLGLGTGMLQAGYMPQQQALEMLRQSQVPAQLASAGQLQGANLYGQLGAAGIESYMGGADLANRLQIAQRQGLMQQALGTQPTSQEQMIAQLLGYDLGEDNGVLGSILGGLGGLFGGLFGGDDEDEEDAGSSRSGGG